MTKFSKLITNDHAPWIKYWDRLKKSADIHKKSIEHIFESIEEAQTTEIPEIRANIEAYMLFQGYSQENLIKGALMKKHFFKFGEHTFSSYKEIGNQVWQIHGGHSLVKLIERNEILILYKAERNLLTRLEEYIKWAGRYEYSKNLEERTVEIMKSIEVKDWDDDIISQFEWRIFEKIEKGW